jgi:hypothetical protein
LPSILPFREYEASMMNSNRCKQMRSSQATWTSKSVAPGFGR